MKGELKILSSGRTPFNWTLPPELRKKFDFICGQKGYIKQAEVDRMVRWWIDVEEGATDQSSESAPKNPPQAGPSKPIIKIPPAGDSGKGKLRRGGMAS